MRTGSYLAGSVVAAAVIVWHAFATREQFFPSMVYLSNSKFSIAVLGNLGFAVALNVYKIVTMTFLGRLRDFEMERVKDKVGQALIETLLAMTIFRQDFTVAFVSQFVVLSFIKIFHWLAQDRVDFIETTPNVTRGQHARLVAFLTLLTAIDYFALSHSLTKTFTHGISVHLLFAFEYTVQASTAMATLAKYAFSMIDLAMHGRWTGKSVAVFYLELALDLLHLVTYSAFFAVVFSTYGIPIHLVRDLYWTFRNFQNRVRDFLRYRRISANMERRFADATQEDMERAGHVCIVCREELGPASIAKRLDCGHVFHMHCLRSWMERQQNCPICRAPVMAPPSTPAAAQPPPRPDINLENVPQERMAEMLREELQRHAEDQLRGDGQVPARQFVEQGGLRHRRQRPADQAHAAGDAHPPGAAGQHIHHHPQYHPMQYQYHPMQYHPAGQWVPAPSMAVYVGPEGMQPFQYPVGHQEQQGPNDSSGQTPTTNTPMGGQQQGQHLHQHHHPGMMPMMQIPMLVPIMAPMPPGAAPVNSNAGSGDGVERSTLDGGAGTGTVLGTPEQHAAAAAIAAAAATAAVRAAPGIQSQQQQYQYQPHFVLPGYGGGGWPYGWTVPAPAAAPAVPAVPNNPSAPRPPSSSVNTAEEIPSRVVENVAQEMAQIGSTSRQAEAQVSTGDGSAPLGEGGSSGEAGGSSSSQGGSGSGGSGGGNGNGGSDDADEVRRRRLERFQNSSM